MSAQYNELFVWSGDKIEDVRFWCEPTLTTEAIKKIGEVDFPAYDGFATFEARGFYLAGIASSIFKKPVVMIRKHKPFYDKMAHAKKNYVNWKSQEESLVILDDTLPKVQRVLVVDDILDSGRSLTAGQMLLASRGISIVGAYYLLDARRDEVPFDFQIASVLKKSLF